jgi:hypothetical protein
VTSRDLMNAGLYAHQVSQLRKVAAGRAVGALRGAGSVIGAAARGGGEEAARQLGGGVAGGAASLGIRALPYAAGAAGLNYLAGDPAGTAARTAVANYRAKMMAQRAAWDPNTGVMY